MAKCTLKNCTSHKPGLWEPIILLWPEKPSFLLSAPASVNVVGHRVCADCVKSSSPIDFIPTKNDWEKICRHFDEKKKARPTLKTAKMTFMIPETALLGGDKLA